MSIEFVPTVNITLEEAPDEGEVLIALRGDTLLLAGDESGAKRLPTGADWPLPEPLRKRLVVGQLDSWRCSLVSVPPDFQLPETLEAMELRPARLLLEAADETAVCRAKELAFWRRSHRFCGGCGKPLEDHETECARRCPACGAVFYPVISPAVIVAVTDGCGRLLLAHNAKFRTRMFALLAGFVEAGETMEGAVRREIREEVGIEVKNIRYFGSQSWPYPNSLMAGFTAEYAGGELAPDGVEITAAGFYTPDELPEIPPPGSIARRLIDHWKSQYKVKER